MDVNTLGVFPCSRACAPHLKKSGRGRIVMPSDSVNPGASARRRLHDRADPGRRRRLGYGLKIRKYW